MYQGLGRLSDYDGETTLATALEFRVAETGMQCPILCRPVWWAQWVLVVAGCLELLREVA